MSELRYIVFIIRLLILIYNSIYTKILAPKIKFRVLLLMMCKVYFCTVDIYSFICGSSKQEKTSIPEFFTVDKVCRALLLCAVKGRKPPSNIISVIFKVHSFGSYIIHRMTISSDEPSETELP